MRSFKLAKKFLNRANNGVERNRDVVKPNDVTAAGHGTNPFTIKESKRLHINGCLGWSA
jgi:hypothetical protein